MQRKKEKIKKQTLINKSSVKIKNYKQIIHVSYRMCFNISGKNLEPETLINSRKESPEYAQLKWKQESKI